ncbi:MAG: alkyl/aryl-sulfatase, partial [Peptococcaceae bacterium]|nr:alkyl/aryl-sulfatase [Peptococcaceae bacterium]
MLVPNGAEQLQAYANRTFEKNILKVAEHIYYFTGFGHSNATLLIGDTSCILVDVLDSDVRGETLKQAIAQITDKPVKTIIYTHGHPDHRGGAKAFADTVEEIIAFAPKRPVLKYSQLVNDILMLRGARQFGYALTNDELITQGLGPREGSTCGEGTYGILPPTTVYTEDSVTRIIDGVTLQMTAAVGETDDQIFVWLPDAKALCCGDNFYACFPNLYAIRGSQYRDISAWVDSLDVIRTYPIETLLPGHGKAIQGTQTVQETLKNYRDAIESVLLQTLDGMNQGLTIDQLAENVKLPETLANLPYLGEHYGSVEWTVRSIFNAYAGWFDGNPTALHPLTASQNASHTIRMMGGVNAVLQEIQSAIATGEYQWGMQLCDLILQLPAASHEELAQAKQYKAQCCLGIAPL